MSQGYGPQDPNQPGYGQQPPQQQPPPQPPAYGAPPPAYGQPAGYTGDAPGFYMGRPLGNWLQRVGAYLIDGLIAGIPIFVASLLVGPNRGTGAGLVVFLLYLVSFGVVVYNRWIMQGRTGQSWGKQVLHLRLLRMADGQPIGGGMAFARDICHLLDSLACYIGWLFPLWDARRQTFADKIIGTVVTAEA
jgi:RDD family